MSDQADQPVNTGPEDVLDYETMLRYTQTKRVTMLEKVSETPESMIENADVSLKILKDMDSTTLNHRKLNVEERGEDNKKEIVNAMLEMTRQQRNRNPFERAADGSAPIPEADPEKLGEYEFVDGEEKVGIENETSHDFVQRMDVDDLDDEEENE